MSELSDIVSIVISRETQAVARASFGIPAIISEFSTSKTNTVFTRSRYYASLTEMTDDGWLTTDFEYKAAQIIFSQNPKPDQIMIGRKDSGDSNWTDALGAIQVEQANWYAFSMIGTKTIKVTFDQDFVASNSIVFTINGTAVTAVPFNADQQTTMGDLETQIEAEISGSAVTISGSPYREMTITITDSVVSSISVVTTGGASQPTASFSYDDTGLVVALKEAAAWAETQKKIFFMSSAEADILTSADTDIATFMQGQNYDRTSVIYHTNDITVYQPAWIETGWPGARLPFDPGSQTWAFKTIAGVASYNLTSAQRTNALAKNANIYTETAGVDITEQGVVASGEYIDIIRGIDWLESRLQEDVFSLLVNTDKVPFTDEGITQVSGIVQAVLEEAAAQGILVLDSIVLTVPLASEVSTANKTARILPDIEFTATLQGAIHKVEITGVVTV
jgi:hypothetical protein